MRRRTATAPAAPIPQRSSLSPTPANSSDHEPPPSRPRFPPGNALVAQGLGARGHHRAHAPMQRLRPPVRALLAPCSRARAARLFSFVISNDPVECLRLVVFKTRFATPRDDHLFLLSRSRVLAFSRSRVLAGTSAAGSARGARPSTGSARATTTLARSGPSPALSSGSDVTGATAGRTCRASTPTTPRPWKKDAR